MQLDVQDLPKVLTLGFTTVALLQAFLQLLTVRFAGNWPAVQLLDRSDRSLLSWAGKVPLWPYGYAVGLCSTLLQDFSFECWP